MAFFQDLVGSAAQPVPRRTEHHRGPRVGSPGAGVSDQARSENGGYELIQPLHVSGQGRLIQGNLGARRLASPGLPDDGIGLPPIVCTRPMSRSVSKMPAPQKAEWPIALRSWLSVVSATFPAVAF